MDRSPAYSIDGIRACPVPCFKVELAITLPALLLKRGQPASQFVAQDEQPARIVFQKFTQLLNGCILRRVAAGRGIDGFE